MSKLVCVKPHTLKNKKSLISFFLCVFSFPAYACLLPTPIEKAFENSDFVLTGTVTGCPEPVKNEFFKVRAKKYWKGEPIPVLKTTTSCDNRALQNNQEYLLYGKKTEEEDTISIDLPGPSCSRSTKLISDLNASWKRFLSLFDGHPGTVDYRIHDFEYLGNPEHIIKEDK